MFQLLEKGSLLLHLAQEQGKQTAVDLFGSVTKRAQRLLESLLYCRWEDGVFDVGAAARIHIDLDSS